MDNFGRTLCRLYGEKSLDMQQKRYDAARKEFVSLYGKSDGIRIFSAPGRTEICGNHTDHNNGKVLAAAVGLDVIAYVVPTSDNFITIKSEGYPTDKIDITKLLPVEKEKNTSAALIRGVVAGFKRNGFTVGGFNAYSTSTVIKGSGVSSSAAYEVLIGTILSGLYNDGRINNVKLAQIAQYAENEYFGKPSGLLDQMASSVGGFVMIDFMKPENPLICPINFDFAESGYSVCIVDTKGSHENLTPEYAAIPQEMKSVAAYFGKKVLREVDESDFRAAVPMLRKACGDRAVLRAMHFFDENKRVDCAAVSLKCGDVSGFIDTLKESGRSSYMYLQNVVVPSYPENQGLAIGLYTAERVLGNEGMTRVHGGGFAGTIQAVVPDYLLERFIAAQEAVFGIGCCMPLYIRPCGGVEIDG